MTHTPAHGIRDSTGGVEDDRAGCPVLLDRLAKTRPMLHVCGHIHHARGIERVKWRPAFRGPDGQYDHGLVESAELWQDPGEGNKKLSLLDLTARSGTPLVNSGRALGKSGLNLRHDGPLSFTLDSQTQHRDANSPAPVLSAGSSQPLDTTQSMSTAKTCGGREDHHLASQEVKRPCPETGQLEGKAAARRETVFINAAIMGIHAASNAKMVSKPIVVDIELPVCK